MNDLKIQSLFLKKEFSIRKITDEFEEKNRLFKKNPKIHHSQNNFDNTKSSSKQKFRQKGNDQKFLVNFFVEFFCHFFVLLTISMYFVII